MLLFCFAHSIGRHGTSKPPVHTDCIQAHVSIAQRSYLRLHAAAAAASAAAAAAALLWPVGARGVHRNAGRKGVVNEDEGGGFAALVQLRRMKRLGVMRADTGCLGFVAPHDTAEIL